MKKTRKLPFRAILVYLLLATFSVVHSQELSSTLEHHQNFKKYIFKNPDSALYFVQQLKNEKDGSKTFLPTYYYHQDLGQYYFETHNLDSSRYHYQRAYEISLKTDDPLLTIKSDIWLATHRFFTRNFQGAEAHWQSVFNKSKAVSYVDGMANAYMGMASLTADYLKKMEYGQKVDSIYSKYGTIGTNLANAYIMMGDIYQKTFEDNDLAILYAKKAHKISDTLKYPSGLQGANILIAKAFFQKKDYKKAAFYYDNLLKQGISQGNQIVVDRALLGLGKISLKMNRPDKAVELLRRCSQKKESTSENSLVGWVHLLWAEVYLMKKDYQKTQKHLGLSRKFSDIGGDIRLFELELCGVEQQYFYATKNFKKAYHAMAKHDSISESLARDRNKNALILSEQRKLEEAKKQEISLLKSQNELAEEKQISQRNMLIAGIVLTTLAGIFLLVLYKNRQRTNEKLRQIDTLKTNFITNISHEFRTPLTVISAPIDEALENPHLPTERRKHFELAKKNSKRLGNLIDQLLEVSKIESGNRTLVLQKNRLARMIEAWSESFSYLARQKNIDFKTVINNKETLAWFDAEAIETIVVNLLGNAIKYTPKKGEILLSARIEDRVLRLTIKNSGNGMTHDQMKIIFNRFYQTDDHNEGSGIGLSLVKELAELHGGSITVDSGLNSWTTFEVVLSLDKTKFRQAKIIENTDSIPRVDITTPETALAKKIILNNDAPIVLIVEDNPDVGVLLTDTFKEEYEVVLAVNGEEGISKALELIPDIIISDVMMPIKDGIALTKTLKEDEKTSHIPIVLLTAKAGDENEIKGIETGADDYVTKPFNKKILLSKVSALITQRKKLQARYSQEVILKPKDIAVTSSDEQFLIRVQEVLDEDLIESSFNVEAFSKAVQMSRMQLHRKLKALTGLSASEFIRTERLKLAANLLRKSDINISEVGYIVGFNDHAYFTKCFREGYNCTPSEYSKQFNASKAS